MELSMLSNELVEAHILLNESRHMIIPTVLIPFTMLSVGISVVASFIAGLFGYKLSTEGPKQLLEVLLKPKVIITSCVTSLLMWVGYNQYEYYKFLPASISTLEKMSKKYAVATTKDYSNWTSRRNVFNKEGLKKKPKSFKLTLKEDWLFKLPKGAFRSGAISSGSYFVGSNDGYIYELDMESGNKVRQFYIGTRVTPGPIVYNNHVYAGEGEHKTHHARIYSFDLKTGEYRNSFETLGHTEGQPRVSSYDGEETLFIVSGKDGVYALDPITLKKKWHQNDGHVDAAVTAFGDRVFVGTGREKGDLKKTKAFAVSYDFKTGKRLWKRELAASSWMPPVVIDRHVCFVMGEIYFKSDLGGVSCFNRKTGKASINFNTMDPLTGIPLVVGSSLYVTDVGGNICKLNTVSKVIDWCKKTESKKFSFSSATYDPYRRVLVLATREDGVYIIDPVSGKFLQKWKPQGWKATFASVAVTEDSWLLVDMSGQVRKLSVN